MFAALPSPVACDDGWRGWCEEAKVLVISLEAAGSF